MKRVFLILVAVVLCVALTIPAIAATITGYTDINIADYVSDKEYVGDEVIVTYDMPLRPYSEYYGTAADGTQGVFATSTDIYFSQEAESNFVTTFTKLIDFGTVTVPATDESWSSEYYSSIDQTLYTHAMVDGVVYELTWVKTATWYKAAFGAYELTAWKATPGKHYFSFSSSTSGTYDLSLGTYSEVSEQIYEYSRFSAALWPLGFSDGSVGVVDISDIREGANFDLTFSYNCRILTDGTSSDPTPSFSAYYLDENGNQISKIDEYLQVPIDSDQDTSFQHTVTFTVPEGAAYFYLLFDTSLIEVKTCRKIDWNFENLIMTCALSALEIESDTLEEVTARLDAIDQKLDDAINGSHGFDSSGSDFSGASGNLSDSTDKMNSAMSSGMASLGSMMSSTAFTGTVSVLAACFDAVFVGHEIEICGIVANPFALLATILSVVILIPLALKFVFRKWGSGGSSGGENDA